MSETESLAERILRLQAEEIDPIAQLILEVKAESRATRELFEAHKQHSGGGNGGLGNGRFALARDIIVLLLIPLALAAIGLLLSNADRLARLEAQAVTMEQLNTVEIRARQERIEMIGVLREQFQRHEDSTHDKPD